jgi:O-antigen/teichoic acid export membrane protein
MALYSRERARSALVHTVSFRVLSQVATVLNTIVLVRLLPVASLGVYSLLYSVTPLITAFASLGLDQTQRRFQPEYLAQGDTRGAAWLVRFVSIRRLLANAALIAVLLLAWRWIAPHFSLLAYRADFALLSIPLLLYYQVIILQCSLAAHMLQRFGVGSAGVLSGVKLMAYLIMGRDGLTLHEAILGDTIAYVCTYGFLFVVHRRQCWPEQGLGDYAPDSTQRGRLMRFAHMSNLSDACSIMSFAQTDNLFIAWMMNPLAVGAYAFYVRLNEMTYSLVPVRLFENIIQPLVFSVRPADAAERLPRYFTFLMNIGQLVQLPMLTFAAAYHREMVDVLFAGKFRDVSWLLPLIVGLAFSDNVLSGPVTLFAQYSERAAIVFRSQIFGLYQIVAMLVMIPLAGLYGAAIATGTLHLLRNLYVWWRVRDHAHWSNWRAAGFYGIAIWGSALAVCYLLKILTAGYGPLLTIICGIPVLAIAALVYLRSPALAASDRELLAGVLRGRESRLLAWLGLLPAR